MLDIHGEQIVDAHSLGDYQCGIAMNLAHAHGTINHMDAGQEAKKPCEHMPIKSGHSAISKTSKVTQSRHLQCLDLATAFCKITIKDTKKRDNKVPEKCKDWTKTMQMPSIYARNAVLLAVINATSL